MKTDKRYWVIAGAYDNKEQAVGEMRKLGSIVKEAAVLDMDQRQDAGVRALTDAVLLLAEGQAETVKQMQILIAALGAGVKIAGANGTEDNEPPAQELPRDLPFSRLIRERVKDLGSSYFEIANKAETFSASSLSKWCNGYTLPRKSCLRELAVTLDLPYSALMDAYKRSIVR